MKNSKDVAKKDPSIKQVKEASESTELSETQLEQVAGGAVDAFVKIDSPLTNTTTIGSATGGAGAGKVQY